MLLSRKRSLAEKHGPRLSILTKRHDQDHSARTPEASSASTTSSALFQWRPRQDIAGVPVRVGIPASKRNPVVRIVNSEICPESILTSCHLTGGNSSAISAIRAVMLGSRAIRITHRQLPDCHRSRDHLSRTLSVPRRTPPSILNKPTSLLRSVLALLLRKWRPRRPCSRRPHISRLIRPSLCQLDLERSAPPRVASKNSHRREPQARPGAQKLLAKVHD